MSQVSHVTLPLPVLFGIVATRAALGLGVGLLLADRLKDKRQVVGSALVAVGVVTTIPAVIALLQARREAALSST